jgi:hypothetical protein
MDETVISQPRTGGRNLLWFVALIIACGLTGFGVYYWQIQAIQQNKTSGENDLNGLTQQFKAKISDLESQIESLKQENEKLKQPGAAKQPAPTLQAGPAQGTEQQAAKDTSASGQTGSGSNIFEVEKIQVGDKIAGLQVTSVAPFDAAYSKIAADNAYVNFSGKATVSGTFHNYYSQEVGFFYDQVCFDVDESSRQKLPQISGDERTPWFCFSNNDFARKQFSPDGSAGNATIVIDKYNLVSYPSEVWNSAELIEVKETSNIHQDNAN